MLRIFWCVWTVLMTTCSPSVMTQPAPSRSTICADPGLGRLRRAARNQRGDEAWVPASHQLDESVREIHVHDASARLRSPRRRNKADGSPQVDVLPRLHARLT